VQLLCRAMQLAPGCYERFELAASSTNERMVISCGEFGPDGDEPYGDGCTVASFDTILELAAAMRGHAAAEHLRVEVSPDERIIVVSRLREWPA